MSDQFPVETRYGVIWLGQIDDIFDCKEDAVEHAMSCCRFEKKLGVAKVVDLEVRLLDQPPCPVEGNPNEAVGKTPLYCQWCGRRLSNK